MELVYWFISSTINNVDKVLEEFYTNSICEAIKQTDVKEYDLFEFISLPNCKEALQ
jgi:hypothetical protein